MSKRRRVTVIGGAGFIGSQLVKFLEQDSCEIVVASRSGDPRRNRPGVSFVRAEVADAHAMRSAIEGAEAVYHLAMGGGATWADFQRDFIDATAMIAKACRESGVERLIYTSSSAALYLGGKGRMDESAGPDAKPEQRSHYSRGKVEAERLLLQAHRSEGLPVVILRPCVVMGRGGMINHSGVGFWANDLCCLGWGKGRNPLPFVLVEDVARAMLAAKDAPGVEGRAFNLAGDVRPSAVEYIEAVGRRTLRNYQFFPRALWRIQLIELAKWGIKALARKPGNDWPSSRDFASRGMFTELDCAAAKEMLGWKPNADPEYFYREAVDANAQPVHPEDLRVEAVR